MLTLNLIRENTDEVIRRLQVKNFDAAKIIEEIISLDKNRRSIQNTMDGRQAELNTTSKAIGELIRTNRKEEAEAARNKTFLLKDEIKELGIQLSDTESRLDKILVVLPNLPHSSVPSGKSAEDNVEIRKGGEMPVLPADAVPHWDLAKKYDIIDFELGNKLTGAGFPVYKGQGARLQRALINFFLEENVRAGYLEIMPPLMVNEDSGFGTGQLPDKDSQMYYVGLDNFYLIPTAEVPVTNIYRM